MSLIVDTNCLPIPTKDQVIILGAKMIQCFLDDMASERDDAATGRHYAQSMAGIPERMLTTLQASEDTDRYAGTAVRQATVAYGRTKIQEAMDTMLSAAQTLRIIQSQALAEVDWKDHKKITTNADEAWATMNRTHKELTKMLEGGKE